MTWTRLSDDFTDRPEMLSVSRSARLLHVEAMVWCNRMTTDGKIPPAALRRITDAEDIDADMNELVNAGLWQAAEDGQWQLDWSDQESSEEVHARAEYRANTQKRYRERKARHERGDHGACDPRFCTSAVTGNATSNKHGNETPSRPVPSRRDRGQGADRAGAGAPPVPRLVVGEDTPLPIPTPWDIRLYINDYDDPHHVEVSACPVLDGAELGDYTATEMASGYRSFRAIAQHVASLLREHATALRPTHGCSPDDDAPCGLSERMLHDSDDPLLNITVPKKLGAPWLASMRDALEQAIEAACEREAA